MKRYLPVVVFVALGVATAFAQDPYHITVPANAVGMGNAQVEIIGVLGKPLGVRTKISGKFIKASGKPAIAIPFEITAIDGKPLPKPIDIRVPGEEKFKEGVDLTLEGYESGSFGSVAEWFSAKSAYPVSFDFNTFFVVVPNNENAGDYPPQ